MPYKIKIDQEKCISCGACESICPDSFVMKEDGKAYAKKSEIKKLSCEKDAESSCPVNAIKIS